MALLSAASCIRQVYFESRSQHRAIALTSIDTVMSRMYNQTGNLYKGPFDCIYKTVTTEGVLAIYKGFFAHLARIWPHTILTLTFAEQTIKVMRKIEARILPRAVVEKKA